MTKNATASRLLLAIFVICANTQAQGPADIVPAQQPVEIELQKDLSSERLKDGQAVEFRLVRPLEINRVELLPSGAPVQAKIKSLKAARRGHRNGRFSVTFEPLCLADGTSVNIGFHQPKRVDDKAEKVAGEVGGVMALAYYYPLIPPYLIRMAQKGKPFTIRAGERYVVYVTGPEPPKQTSAPSSRE